MVFKLITCFVLFLSFEIEEPCIEGSTKRKSRLITVTQYYKITRNYVVKYPNLPCLHVGNVNKKTAIPIEVIYLF